MRILRQSMWQYSRLFIIYWTQCIYDIVLSFIELMIALTVFAVRQCFRAFTLYVCKQITQSLVHAVQVKQVAKLL